MLCFHMVSRYRSQTAWESIHWPHTTCYGSLTSARRQDLGVLADVISLVDCPNLKHVKSFFFLMAELTLEHMFLSCRDTWHLLWMCPGALTKCCWRLVIVMARSSSGNEKRAIDEEDEEEEFYKLRPANKTDHLCQSWQ